MSSTLGTAVVLDLVESNIALKVKPPAKQESATVVMCYDFEQTRALLAYLEEPYTVTFPGRRRKDGSRGQERVEEHRVSTQMKCLYHIAAAVGTRRGEVTALKWCDVDFKRGTININKAATRLNKSTDTKGPKNRTSERAVTLPPSLMQMLKQHRTEQKEYRLNLGTAWNGADWLFIQADGKRLHICTANSTLKKIVRRYNTLHPEAPLPVLPLNSLRHTSATLSIASGADIKSVSARLGHSRTSTTLNIYSHALAAGDAAIAAAMEEALYRKQA